MDLSMKNLSADTKRPLSSTQPPPGGPSTLFPFTTHTFLLDRDGYITMHAGSGETGSVLAPLSPSEEQLLWDLLPSPLGETLRAQFNKAMEGRESETETPVERNGQTRNFRLHCRPAFAGKARTGVFVDLTETLPADRSDESYRTLFFHHPLAMWKYDTTTLQMLEANQAALELYGYNEDAFLKLTLLDIRPQEDHQEFLEEIENTRAGRPNQQRIFRHLKKDGSIFWVQVIGNPIHHRGKMARLVSVIDITERILAEQALQKSNERFRLAAKASSEALWEYNFQTGVAYISEAYTDMLGWKANIFRKFDEWPDYIHPADREETVSGYLAAISDGQTERWEKEYRYRKVDGSYAYVHDKAAILRNEAGEAIKVVGALRDITTQKEAEAALRKSNERFLLASRAASDAIYDWDLVNDDLHWGEGMQTLFGWSPREVNIQRWEELVHPKDRERARNSLTNFLAHPRKKFWKEEYRFAKADGSFSVVLDRGFALRDDEGRAIRMIGSVQDISERKYYESIISLERSIFELSANPDMNLNLVVTRLLEGVEEMHTDAIASVLLLREDGTIEPLAAPSLPAAFTEGIAGLTIGPKVGSCGSAMFTRKTVIVADIETDPLWEDHREFTLGFGLRACWSLPIIHSTGRVIGSFAIYHTQPKYPTSAELTTIERLRNMLRIVMENRLSLQEIKIANERFDIMMRATHDLIWDWNLETGIIYRDPAGLKKVYGVQDAETIDGFQNWLERVHPEDHTRVSEAVSQLFQSQDRDHFDVEYRFRHDNGSYTHVYDRGIILRNAEGKPVRMIGAAQDVSERKRLERELLDHELEYQKAINQATVETQERERTEIGKELHDNVNQVLTTTKLYLDLAASNPELKDELIQKSSKNIIGVINEIRQLSRSLMDPSIGDLGLQDSVNDLIENINLTRKLHVCLKASPDFEALLDKSQKLTIFRIIQEALNNAIRHARATSVIIHFTLRGENAEVTIEDDGIGFDVKTVRKGAGLKNIQNRIYLINGTHTLISTPNQGSRIIINFPITSTKTELSN
jgi:PAS domain S-box-containing protein